MSANNKIPYVLAILDGVGHRVEAEHNAVLAARTPILDGLKDACVHGLISGSGLDVGLPDGQFGNSEVGHMNLGAGRVLFQDSTKISKAIADGDFFENAAFDWLFSGVKKAQGSAHVLGLLSDGGVHSHQDHIEAICQKALSDGVLRVYVHAFLDGRDTPPKSAQGYLQRLQDRLDGLNRQFEGKAVIASAVGRFFAMDRDKRWDRVQAAFDLLTAGKAARTANTAQEAIEAAYRAGETDEFVAPTLLDAKGPIQDGDGVIFMNFRADRARELTQALIDERFDGFARGALPKLSGFVMLTKYSDELAANALAKVAYLPTPLCNTLGEYIQNLGKTQLRIAETEKYAHVTFFFSGGREQEYEGETRILVKSPDVKTYDLKPEMSAFEVTEKLVEAIESGAFDLLIVNYANGDMVGHSGDFAAAVKAVEAVDTCLGKVVEAVRARGGHLLITADHGNCEQMHDPKSGQAHTQHTTELVPFIYVGNKKATVRKGGRLCDVAPTLLALMGQAQPAEMTGQSLLVFEDADR